MVNIELDDGTNPILLRSYIFGWELCRKRKVKDSWEWAAEKWYASLPTALNAISEFKLRNSDATSILELHNLLQKIRTELMEVYNANIKA